jgi:hypothetical protein
MSSLRDKLVDENGKKFFQDGEMVCPDQNRDIGVDILEINSEFHLIKLRVHISGNQPIIGWANKEVAENNIKIVCPEDQSLFDGRFNFCS